LAKHYEDAATEMRAKADEHKKLLAQYETRKSLYGKQAQSLISHCQGLIRIYEQGQRRTRVWLNLIVKWRRKQSKPRRAPHEDDSQDMSQSMGRGYKIIPLIVLALYAFCSVCPSRFLPAGIRPQTAEASEPHDCNKGNKHEPDNQCQALSSQYLPSPAAKFVHVLTVQGFVAPPHAGSLAFNFLLSSRTTLLSTTDPPIALLNTKLRI
jgi:hypothetical protein